ncbi:membrane protein insertion efficiency factor YidD [Corynebacterium bovis]|uniref:membrane protein insertion efficiency factor YidD n=1 Tax=Corynebacterium bovis TaxID=36808 RepID=UPI002550CF87|nr:membrane protein insertion efficiency factor YidD [Corynebacterium bovis]MDK8511291.1 membrane protein insertion efficiency factor YidD [Corynebacterium bovis]
MSARRSGLRFVDGPGRLARGAVRGYQLYLSPLKMGPTCRFEPTCSSYALTALERHGVVVGLILTAARLAKCGPWHPGGWYPVPARWPRRMRWPRRGRRRPPD